VNRPHLGLVHQLADIVFDIAHRHPGDHPFQPHPFAGVKIRLVVRGVGILTFIRDQIIHQQHPNRLDARRDRFIRAVSVTAVFG